MDSLRSLNIPEELIVMLLNEQTGYFYQVEGWTLNCVMIGAVLADLSLKSRIDTDEESLFLIDSTKTGEPILDLCLEEIESHPDPQSTRYWIEKLTIHSEKIIDTTLERLVNLAILTHHDGGFYTLNHSNWHNIKSEIEQVIFTDIIPSPRDSLIIGLLNACDVIRFIFELDDKKETKIKWICNLETINRKISSGLEQAIITPAIQQTPLSKKIPKVSLRYFLSNRRFWDGNIPALFANIANRYGPVFQLQMPFKKPLTFLAGPEVNRWVHRNARTHMTSGNYFRELEEACGAQGLITSLDGADHFRLRKVMRSYYSAEKFVERLDDVCQLIRQFMSSQNWQAGSEIEVKRETRLMINLQMTQITVSTDSQDIFEELAKWKERASNCYVGDLMPNFMARTPAMTRRFKLLGALMRRIEQNHTPFQRAGAVRELADDVFSLHRSDPQFLPEQNLAFMLAAAPTLQSIYVGDLLGFAVFEMANHPVLAARIREEANTFFDSDDLDRSKFLQQSDTVSRRFLMECLRMYPVVCVQARNVANSCTVENFALPLGERVLIAQSAAHYMDDSFPDPYKFEIDRYLPPRNEHQKRDYAPYGLGTHMCVGYVWMNLQMIVALMTIAHYFEFAPLPKNYKLKIDPLPTLSVSKKLKLRIANQLRELPA